MSGEDDRPQRDIKNHILFEIATEVAHRGMSSLGALHVVLSLPVSDLRAAVGGIYSVLKSKAPVTTAEYGERYTLIGPLNHQSVGWPWTNVPFKIPHQANNRRPLSRSRSSSPPSLNLL